MTPRLANLRANNLPNPPPPPVTRATSPDMSFIWYLRGMNILSILSIMAVIVNSIKLRRSRIISTNDIVVRLDFPYFLSFFFFLIRIQKKKKRKRLKTHAQRDKKKKKSKEKKKKTTENQKALPFATIVSRELRGLS